MYKALGIVYEFAISYPLITHIPTFDPNSFTVGFIRGHEIQNPALHLFGVTGFLATLDRLKNPSVPLMQQDRESPKSKEYLLIWNSLANL